MQNRSVGYSLLALATIVGMVIAVSALDLLLPDASRAKDLLGIVQSGVTVLAIVLGGFFAAIKLELFRDFEPHLTISHDVNHRRLENGYLHIDVKATLTNSSKVRVELQEGFFLLQRIAPVLDSEDFVESNMLYPAWPVLDQSSFHLGDDEINIEPGQSLQEVFQFILDDGVKTVLIHYFFLDSRFLENSRGWGITDVYDIVD